jgi:hypothetical protein
MTKSGDVPPSSQSIRLRDLLSLAIPTIVAMGFWTRWVELRTSPGAVSDHASDLAATEPIGTLVANGFFLCALPALITFGFATLTALRRKKPGVKDWAVVGGLFLLITLFVPWFPAARHHNCRRRTYRVRHAAGGPPSDSSRLVEKRTVGRAHVRNCLRTVGGSRSRVGRCFLADCRCLHVHRRGEWTPTSWPLP